MNVLRFLFSVQGRLSRRPFWFGVLVMGGLTRVSAMILEEAQHTLSEAVLVYLVIVGVWSCIALQVKRLHDINLSGWFLLVNLIPIAGQLVTLILAGFKRGDAGPNRFGPNPAAHA